MIEPKSLGTGVGVGFVLGAGLVWALAPKPTLPVPEAARQPIAVPIVQAPLAPTPRVGTLAVPDPPRPGPDVDALRMENQLLQGQLRSLGGIAFEWPEGSDPLYRAPQLTAWLEDEVGALPGIELLRVDCDEFPCMAVVRYAEGLTGDTRHVAPLQQRFPEAVEGGTTNISLMNDGHRSTATIAFLPAESAGDPGLKARMQTRHVSALEVADPE